MWLLQYNEYFDVLICKFSNKNINRMVEKENIVIFYTDDIVVGINIFNPQINKKTKYLLWDQDLISYVKKTIDNNKLVVNFENNPHFIICKINECKDVENTNLKVCKVDVGNDTIQIVTNASNAKNNLITVVAMEGCFLNDGTYIGKSKINGIDSHGMFCSAKTLGLIDRFSDKSGILEVNNLKDKIGENIFSNI